MNGKWQAATLFNILAKVPSLKFLLECEIHDVTKYDIKTRDFYIFYSIFIRKSFNIFSMISWYLLLLNQKVKN